MCQSGDISMMKNLPHSCQGRVYRSTLGARCVYRGERQRHYCGWGCAECCGQEQLRCDGGSVTSTVEAPDRCNATVVCKSSMRCCSSTAVDSSPCMRVAPTRLSSGPTRAVGTKKKSMTPSLLHERHLWRAMYCKSMVISK